MNLGMVINVYVDVNEGVRNPFDHPTNLERFIEENTLRATVESINKLKIDSKDKLTIYIVAAATQEETKYDEEIRKRVIDCFCDCPYELLTYTNSDIKFLSKNYSEKFLSAKGYPELRNLGFIIPSVLEEDIIIQIDDDELMREDYLIKMREVLESNREKYLFTAPYEKNGTVRIKTEDRLKTWKKFSPMDSDMVKFYVEAKDVSETLFGFGGNMFIRREFAENIFYPLEVPRGEDFSMLLAARLVHENGNEHASLKCKDDRFRAYFAPFEEVTIIHKPPYEAKSDFLKYFENNMKRFIMEWGIFSKQDNLTIDALKELSYYIAEMIGHSDIKSYLKPIMDEIKEQGFAEEKVDQIHQRLLHEVDKYESQDRWEEYKILQKDYIDLIQSMKNPATVEQLKDLGKC